ncbi:MAG: hypothetical protein ACERKV_00350 [Clostridiaceae bacterium]
MNEMWNNIGGFEKIFWIIAIPSTALFIVQMILLLIGLDHGGDIPDLEDIQEVDGVDFDHSPNYDFNPNVPLKLFTIRNTIVFFTVFSWAGITGIRNDFSKIGVFVFAFVLSFIVVLILSFVFYLLLKLTQRGNVNIKNAIGSEGIVYYTIPRKNHGIGKVQVTFQGALREYEAITDGREIKTGSSILVTGIKDDILIVTLKNKI